MACRPLPVSGAGSIGCRMALAFPGGRVRGKGVGPAAACCGRMHRPAAAPGAEAGAGTQDPDAGTWGLAEHA